MRITSTRLTSRVEWLVEQDRTSRPALLHRNGHLQVWTGPSSLCQVCVWSLRDVGKLVSNEKSYVINKFRSDYDPFIIECIRYVVISSN